MKNKNKRKKFLSKLWAILRLKYLISLAVAIIFCMCLAFIRFQNSENPLLGLINPGITLSERISSEQVKTFCQTQDGYMWIGTESGLNRYDGVNYIQYSATDDSLSLMNNNIHQIVESHFNPGHLLIGSFNGSCIYTPDNKFIPLETGRVVLSEIDSCLVAACFHNRVALYRIDLEKLSGSKQKEIKINAKGIVQKERGKFWIFAGNSALLYDSNLDLLETVDLPTVQNVYIEDWAKAMILCDAGFCEFEAQNGELKNTAGSKFLSFYIGEKSHIIFNSKDLYASHEYASGNYLLFDLKNRNLRVEKFENFFNSELGTVYRDLNDNFWIGSRGFGIETIFAQNQLFNSNRTICQYFDKKDITSVFEGKNRDIFICTGRRNLFRYSDDGTVHPINLKALGDYFLFHFLYTRDNRLLISANSRIYVGFLENDEYKIRESHNIETVHTLCEDKDGDICIGGETDLFILKKNEHQLTATNLDSQVGRIVQLRDGRLALGSIKNGVMVYDKQKGTMVNYGLPNVKKGISVCSEMLEGQDGKLWIATTGVGIFSLDLNTGEYRNFHSQNMNKDISCMVADPFSKDIWLGTLGGLTKFDTSTGQFYTFSEKDGVKGREFYSNCAIYTVNNLIVFGGKKGLTVFNPRKIKTQSGSSLKLSNIRMDHRILITGKDKEIAPQGLKDGMTLKIPYGTNSIEINFTTLDYGNNSHTDLQYRTEGIDKDWIYAQNQRVFYSTLESGSYHLYVRTLDSDGNIGNTFLVNIDMGYPWWNQAWMRYVCWPLLLLVFLLIIIRLWRDAYIQSFRIRQTLREKVTQKYVNDMNMKFFNNISHEFRTPLTLIKGASDILRNQLRVQDLETQENVEHSFRIIQSNTGRMIRLVNQLLEFNKLEHDMLQLKVQQQTLGFTLQQIMEMFSYGFEEKSIHFIVENRCPEERLWIDVDKYEKVVENLLSNALKFTPRDGTVKLDVSRISQEEANGLFPNDRPMESSFCLLTTVTDTGIGIPAEMKEYVFDRYFQAEQGNSKINGTGIGLCYSKGLVKLHHGKIKVADNPDGHGTQFLFILPLDDVYREEEKIIQKQKSVPEISEPERQEEDEGQKPVILAVDDDADMLQFLKMAIGTDFKVVTQTSATEAFSILPNVKPNLIISDVMMLGLDGYKFCNLLKNDPSYCHIPVILLTAKTSLEDRIDGLNMGADAYMTKPFESSYLQAMIGSLLSNRKKMQHFLNSSTSLNTEVGLSPTIQQVDAVFMQKLYQFMESHIREAELDLGNLLDVMNMSRSKFFYKIKELTGQTPNAFFKVYKLNRAAEMILEGQDKISYIAEITGFSSASHFTFNFKKQFGVLPSEYKKR